ncbi:MAG: creatininase [Chloroflexi bacterium]|nr:MAG: creatininase [Chloroflexota bacterium]
MTSEVHYMNWEDYDAAQQQTDLVLIPFGAVEVYGPHLPLGADGIATTALARGIAEQVPALISPLIPVGYSKMLQSFPGTLSVKPASLVAYARDVAESFILWGCKRILWVNGHAGNVPFINELSAELEERHGVRCAQIDWWRFIQPLVKDLETAEFLPHGHASEFGTSVMLHLVPQYVKMERAVKTANQSPDQWPDFLRTRSYRAQSPTGVLGDGTLGTAEKGAETMRRAIERAVAFINSDEFRAP